VSVAISHPEPASQSLSQWPAIYAQVFGGDRKHMLIRMKCTSFSEPCGNLIPNRDPSLRGSSARNLPELLKATFEISVAWRIRCADEDDPSVQENRAQRKLPR